MGLFDWFRKKNADDGTWRRPEGAGAYCGDAETGNDGCGTFRITVEDVFSITGRGTAITGQVEAGSVTKGDKVMLRRVDGSSREVIVTGIEMFRKLLDTAKQGDHVGLLLGGLEKRDVGRGDILEKNW